MVLYLVEQISSSLNQIVLIFLQSYKKTMYNPWLALQIYAYDKLMSLFSNRSLILHIP